MKTTNPFIASVSDQSGEMVELIPQDSQTLTADLKPCPFCGGVGHLDDTCRDHSVECGTCGAMPRYKDLHKDVSRSEAVKAWNRRPSVGVMSESAIIRPDQDLTKALEELRIDCQVPIDEYHKNGPQWTSREGAEYCDQSYVLEKMAELITAIDAALASAKGAK